MAEMNLPTMIDTNGFGGAGLGAGFIGGLVLGSIWNGGWGGFGGNRAGQVGADVAISNQLEHVSDQVQQGALSAVQSAGATQMQIANTGAGITAGINQQTIAQLQGQAGLQQQICCATGRLSGEIDQTGDQVTGAINVMNSQMADRLCAINSSVINQGYEARLQAQGLASQLQQQHAQLSAQIASENCQDRELMREIAAQQVRDKLAEAQAENAALKAQINLQGQLQAQTLYLVDQLKPAATAAAGA